MFNPEHLATLQAVVEEGTVLAAADRLGYTPSAVSQQLARLQREVHQPIMTRRGRANAPTKAAYVLVRLAQQMQQLEESARAELEGLQRKVTGSLVLSGFPSAMRGLLVPVAAACAKAYPEVQLTLREMSPEESVAAVRRGDVDLAVVHDWTDKHVPMRDGVKVWPVGLDAVDVVASSALEVPIGPDGVDPVDLHDQVWIDDTPGVFSDWLLDALDSRNIPYRIGATVEDINGRVMLVAEGFGVSLLPRLGRGTLPPGVVTLPVVGAPTRRIFAVHRDSSERRPAIHAALGLIRSVWDREGHPIERPKPETLSQ